MENLWFSFKREREENYFKPLWMFSAPFFYRGSKGLWETFDLNAGIQNSQVRQICKQEKSQSQIRNINILNVWEPLFHNMFQWNSTSQDTLCQLQCSSPTSSPTLLCNTALPRRYLVLLWYWLQGKTGWCNPYMHCIECVREVLCDLMKWWLLHIYCKFCTVKLKHSWAQTLLSRQKYHDDYCQYYFSSGTLIFHCLLAWVKTPRTRATNLLGLLICSWK